PVRSTPQRCCSSAATAGRAPSARRASRAGSHPAASRHSSRCARSGSRGASPSPRLPPLRPSPRLASSRSPRHAGFRCRPAPGHAGPGTGPVLPEALARGGTEATRVMRPPRGALLLLLHAHLPYVRHPDDEDHLEEEWLREAVLECYLPLLE